jgi:hypothetical protein
LYGVCSFTKQRSSTHQTQDSHCFRFATTAAANIHYIVAFSVPPPSCQTNAILAQQRDFFWLMLAAADERHDAYGCWIRTVPAVVFRFSITGF